MPSSHGSGRMLGLPTVLQVKDVLEMKQSSNFDMLLHIINEAVRAKPCCAVTFMSRSSEAGQHELHEQ